MRQLHHLPELSALQSDLLRVFPLTSDSAPQTIAQRLQQIPAGSSAFPLEVEHTTGHAHTHTVNTSRLLLRTPEEDAAGESEEIHHSVEQPQRRAEEKL